MDSARFKEFCSVTSSGTGDLGGNRKFWHQLELGLARLYQGPDTADPLALFSAPLPRCIMYNLPQLLFHLRCLHTKSFIYGTILSFAEKVQFGPGGHWLKSSARHFQLSRNCEFAVSTQQRTLSSPPGHLSQAGRFANSVSLPTCR